MYLGVLGEYGKSLLVYSPPCELKYFPRILRIGLHTLCVFGDDFVYRKQA
jgi:hypothetical protein